MSTPTLPIQGFRVNALTRLLCSLLLVLVSTAAPLAQADPAVKKAFETRYPDVKVENITRAAFGNLWEIYAGGDILYTDDKVSFLLLGTLVDAATRENITEARLRKLSAIKFSDLPLDQAIRTVIGNGSRKLAVFSDPYCGYCKRFEPDILGLKDVTIYTYLYPIIRPESVPVSKKVWCSKDRVKAWQDLMLRNIDPTAGETCKNPIDEVVTLGRRLRVTGTPTTFFEDGERVAGALTRDIIENKFAAIAGAKK
ncbi:MAG: DsbC family protein [Betaproteobacteria bacterium]|nr:DsbC family protein [Betaproteobacteria bacterium]